MKKKLHLLIFLCPIYSGSISYSQSTAPFDYSKNFLRADKKPSTHQKVKFLPEYFSMLVGESYQVPVGSYVKKFKREINDTKNTLPAFASISGKMTPVFNYVIGIRSGWLIKKNLWAETGLQLTKRGFQLKVDSKRSDPDYRYDANAHERLTFETSIIEIPVTISYAIDHKSKAELTVLLTDLLKNTARASVSYQKDVIINGEKDADWSIMKQASEQDYKQNCVRFSAGICGSYYRNAGKNIFIGIIGQYGTKYFSFEESNIVTLSLIIAVKYNINL